MSFLMVLLVIVVYFLAAILVYNLIDWLLYKAGWSLDDIERINPSLFWTLVIVIPVIYVLQHFIIKYW